jgi:hypothetical protein
MAVYHQRFSLFFFLLGDQVYQVASSFVRTRQLFIINSVEYFSRNSYILAIQNVTNVTVVDLFFDVFFFSREHHR